MRILLLGASGQVGHELRRALAPLGGIVCTTRSGTLDDGADCEAADFDDPASLGPLVARIAPEMVVNAAAYTAVDRAESDRDAAFRANTDAPRELARACAQRDALLVHYSTDYVFDGTGTRPYHEDDPTSPLGVYGESKLAGEQAVQASGARHMIFRTAWVYADRGRNFMLTMLRLAGERDELRVVADQTGTPTPASLIADATATMLGRPFAGSGLWHLTAQGGTTWHGFAEAIVERAHALGRIAKRPRVLPIATADYPTPARRPGWSRLDCSRFERDAELRLPDWKAALEQVLR